MMVSCVLVNRTHWRKVKKVFENLKARCETPEGMLKVPEEEMAHAIRGLGFQNRRARTLHRLAAAWIEKAPESWTQVLDLPGCGLYAAQSFQIFVQGERPSGEVQDHKLSWYLEQTQ